MVVTTEERIVTILVVAVALIGCRFDRARMHLKRKRWFELWHYGFSLFCTLSQKRLQLWRWMEICDSQSEISLGLFYSVWVCGSAFRWVYDVNEPCICYALNSVNICEDYSRRLSGFWLTLRAPWKHGLPYIRNLSSNISGWCPISASFFVSC